MNFFINLLNINNLLPPPYVLVGAVVSDKLSNNIIFL